MKTSRHNTNIRMINAKILVLVSLILVLISGLSSITEAAGASLYLSPSSGNYRVGDTFSVSAMVNTGGVAINATEATLTFDAGKLEVKSISKSGSIFTMWVKEPKASGSTISFGGGLPAPGYNGSSGRIIVINFRAKSKGVAKVNFSSGQVLPNSPNPTNILASKGSGSYTISIVSPPPPPTPVPSKPEIISPTHPDQNKWYKNDDPKFSWELPSGVTNVSFSFDQKATTYPDYTSEGLVGSKTYKDVEDGAWYFHLKFRNKNGWSSTSHYKVQVDATPPEHFEIKIDNKEDSTNPRPILLFKATDVPSGINFYEIKIGEEKSIKTDKTSYQMPFQSPGKHSVVVKAVDMAGNYTIEAIEVIIEAIEMPVITEYSKVLYLGDPFFFKGKSLPEIIINIYLQKEGKKEIFEVTVKSDKEGNFTYSHDRLLERGMYKVWIIGEDSRGAKSNPSAKISISVAPPAFIRIGRLAIDCLSIIIILFALIALLLFGIWLIWIKIKEKRKRLKKEVTEAEKTLYKAFDVLRKEVREEVENFDLRPGLNSREKRIRDKLENALKISKKIIEKEIKDIRRELEKRISKK